ncbi:hypothetical protein MKX03_035111 [Papaver bracteatum]|nr:hypothetical protein MKX03_035111 [Papaver bracteatum]
MVQHHTISGQAGKLVTGSEVNCNAVKYYEIWKHHEDVPNVTLHISGVKVIEGHGTTLGCKTTYNDETRTTHHSGIGGDMMKVYKKFVATLVVNPKANGHGSIVSWTIDYDKIHEDYPIPISYLQFFQFQIEDFFAFFRIRMWENLHLPKMAQHHTISGQAGKLVTASEVNYDADKYYEIWKNHEDLPNVTPHIPSVNVIEGHGTTSGCVKEWNYLLEGKNLHVHEKTIYNDETRNKHHSAIGGDIMKVYKKFVVTLVVNPKANRHGSIVSWTIEYEKLHEDSPFPIDYLQFFQFQIEDVNSHLCSYE